MQHRIIVPGLFAALLVSNFALAGQVVSTPSQFPKAASEACDYRGIGDDCRMEFKGGYVAFGICTEVPNGGGELTCHIDESQIPADCKNNALGTKGSWLTFGGLAAFLIFIRRRRPNV